jgi:hypothetical protein
MTTAVDAEIMAMTASSHFQGPNGFFFGASVLPSTSTTGTL